MQKPTSSGLMAHAMHHIGNQPIHVVLDQTDRMKIDIDLDEGISKERAFCGVYLPKDHPACLEYLAAWQAGRRLVVTVTLA